MKKSIKEQLIEGKYEYLNNGTPYSEESFSISREEKPSGKYTFEASTHTRVRTGEFLKILISYLTTTNFEPLNVRIERQLGDKNSIETFDIDQKTSNVSYKFESADKVESFNKIVSGRFHFATPCFSLSMLMTQMRKLDPVHRTPYTIITSKNIWDYEEPFQEEEVYVELQSLDPAKINISGKELTATHCKLLQVDENGTIATEGHDIYLSKYYSVPYQGDFGNGITIQIDKLKNFSSQRI